MKKEIILCLLIDSLKVGGKERVMSELANYFSRKSVIIVHLVIYGSDRTIAYPLSDHIRIHTPGYVYRKSRRWAYAIRTQFFLRRKVKEIRPSVVMSFGELWNSYVITALWGLKIPVYISDRCQPDKTFGTIHHHMRKKLYPYATGMIAQTIAARDIYRREFKKLNVQVIGNPIRDFGDRPEIDREHIVLTVGRLIPMKNHLKLMEIFLKIGQPGWKLVIVGGDAGNHNRLDEMRNWVRRHHAADRIRLEGERKDVESYYLKSSIFAIASTSEGFPNVIGEAQSAGLPVVAFDCVAGPSEMIRDGSDGFLVPLNDYEIFKERLETLMASTSLREEMGRNARSSVMKFSVDSIGETYLDFITQDLQP